MITNLASMGRNIHAVAADTGELIGVIKMINVNELYRAYPGPYDFDSGISIQEHLAEAKKSFINQIESEDLIHWVVTPRHIFNETDNIEYCIENGKPYLVIEYID